MPSPQESDETILCASCGNPVVRNEAYSNGLGEGPWHRLCIPPKAHHFEQRLAAAAFDAIAPTTAPRGDIIASDRHPYLRVVK